MKYLVCIIYYVIVNLKFLVGEGYTATTLLCVSNAV